MVEEMADYAIEQHYGSKAKLGGSQSLQTHQYINQNLCGNLMEMDRNFAKVSLKTNAQMSVDEYDLVHGGFIFSAADFAAMAAINDPYVVLVGSQTSFYAPVKVGDEILFEAESKYNESRKREVMVVGKVNEIKIFSGVFDAVILDRHVLKMSIKKVKKDSQEKEKQEAEAAS
jgi:acyl-coenzyme A thioesterase PaaI-like protein